MKRSDDDIYKEGMGLAFILLILFLTLVILGITIPRNSEIPQKIESTRTWSPGMVYEKYDNQSIEIFGYGRYNVTKEEYDSVEIGDQLPDFIKERLEVNNTKK